MRAIVSLIFFYFLFIFIACQEKKYNNEAAVFKKKEDMMNDTVSGIYTYRYPSGIVKQQGKRLKGMKEGIWKNYNENGNLISVEYYFKNEKVTNIETEDFNFNRIMCDEISVSLPSKWTIKKNFKQTLILAVKPQLSDTIFSPTINILRVEIPKAMSFPEFIIENKKDMAKGLQELKFRNEREFTVNGHRSYEILYFAKAEDKKLGVLSTYVLNGNNCYIVTCLAEGKSEEFVKYKDLFQEITSSISFSISQTN